MFATGVGNTDAAFILGTGKIWEKVPESIKFIFNGKMPSYLTAKDLILQNWEILQQTGQLIVQWNLRVRQSRIYRWKRE
jgi:homoaconitase/3-isopropylmalate dehydratase large subunit